MACRDLGRLAFLIGRTSHRLSRLPRYGVRGTWHCDCNRASVVALKGAAYAPERATTNESRPQSTGPPAALIFPSLGLLLFRLSDLLHISIERYAVEWHYDDLAAVVVVSKLLIFRHIDDGKCEGRH